MYHQLTLLLFSLHFVYVNVAENQQQNIFVHYIGLIQSVGIGHKSPVKDVKWITSGTYNRLV